MPTISNTFQQTLKHLPAIAPILLGKAIEVSLQDKRIANLANGVCLVGSGICMMASSGITKLLGRKKQIIPTTESTFSQTKQICLALAGFTAAAYGVYLVASTLFQLYAKEPSVAACESEYYDAMHEILSCPEGKKLYDDVAKQGDFKFQCMSHDQAKDWGQGFADPTGRKIYISTYAKNGIRQTMSDLITFELCNLKQSKALNQNVQNMCLQDLDVWAVNHEKIEMKSCRMFHKIVSACKKVGVWTGDMYKALALPEKELLALQESTGHTDAHRLRWINACAPHRIKEAVEWFRFQSALTGRQLPANINAFNT